MFFFCLDENKSVEEITSQLFSSLNLTAINFGGQLNNIDAYRSKLDKIIRTALTSTNQTISINLTDINKQDIHIITAFKNNDDDQQQEQTSTTTTDTREYTEKRTETINKN